MSTSMEKRFFHDLLFPRFAVHQVDDVRPFVMQDFFRFKNGPFFPLLIVTSFFVYIVRV